jgi:hypothetical protein
MSDIFNPVGRVVPGGFTGPNLVTGVISDPPRNLIGLAPGTILKGTVLGRGSDGLTSVATDKGVVKVATAAQLPAGSNVTLEVRNAGDRLQVLILSVDTATGRQGATSVSVPSSGTAGSGGVSGSAPPPPPTSDGSTEPTTRPPPSIEFVGNSVRAIVVNAPLPSTLLPTPDVDIEVFTPPQAPIEIPADAVQKAQLLAQARLLVQTPADLFLAATQTQTGAGTPVTAPGTPIPVAGQPIPTTTPNATTGTTPVATQIQATSPVLLPPDVAQRIAALFAEAGVATQTATFPSQLGHMNVGGPMATGQAPLIAKIATGAEVTLNIIAVLPTKGGAIEIAPEAVKLTGAVVPLLGTVLGYTRAGHPVIETPAGAIMLQQRTRLPVGAQVALVLDPVVSAPAAAAAAGLLPVTSPQQALFQLSSSWPTLDDVISILRGAGGGAAADGTPPPPPGVPQTGPKLAAGLAAAMAALRSGNAEELLGPLLAGRKAPADKEDAVKRLREEFTQLSSLAQDRPGADWRALFLPIYDERIGLTQINLYYRRGGGGKKDEPESKDSGTRFLVEVNFAALGAFQLDGLVRGKRFDLMVRSRRPVPPSQRRELFAIFEDALALTGNAGGLEFRTVDRFPVSPLEELRQSHEQVTA